MRSVAEKQDLFENKPVLSAILNLAFPSIMGQVILVIYNMADTYFVGRTGNAHMITAVAVCMPAYMFLSAISNLFGIGGGSVISRALGIKRTDRARSTASFAIWGCIAVTLLYSLGVLAFSDTFLDLLGGKNPIVHEHAKKYILVTIVGGGVVTATNTLFSHLIRAEGHSLQASIGIALGGVLNIALDPLFMFKLLPAGNEALGAGIATTLSNVIALVYFIVYIAVKRKHLTLSMRLSRAMFDDHIPGSVIAVGLPACLMTLCENISYAILDNLMMAAGVAAQTGIGVAKKVNMLAHCIVRGMSQGVLPLIGYTYACGKRKRMKQVIYLSGMMSIALSLVCMAINLTLSEPLIRIFINVGGTSGTMDEAANLAAQQAIRFGAEFLQILTIGAPFSACAYAIISFFQATGKGKRSLLLALLRKGILDIPLMFVLRALLTRPEFGIVAATPAADIVCCIVGLVLFISFIRRHGNDKPVAPPPPTKTEEIDYALD